MDVFSLNFPTRMEQMSVSVSDPKAADGRATNDNGGLAIRSLSVTEDVQPNSNTSRASASLSKDYNMVSVPQLNPESSFCLLYHGQVNLQTPTSLNTGTRTLQMKAAAKSLQYSVDNIRLVVITVDELLQKLDIYNFNGRNQLGAKLFSVPFESFDLIRYSKKDRCFIYFTVQNPDRDLALLADGGKTSPTVCHVFHTFHPHHTNMLFETLNRKVNHYRTKRRAALLQNRKIDVVDKYYEIHDQNNNINCTNDKNNNTTVSTDIGMKHGNDSSCITSLLDLNSSLPEVSHDYGLDAFETSSIFLQKGVQSSSTTASQQQQSELLTGSNIELVEDIFKMKIQTSHNANQVEQQQQQQLPTESFAGNNVNKNPFSNSSLIASSYRFPDISAAVGGVAGSTSGNPFMNENLSVTTSICNSQTSFQGVTTTTAAASTTSSSSSMFSLNSQSYQFLQNPSLQQKQQQSTNPPTIGPISVNVPFVNTVPPSSVPDSNQPMNPFHQMSTLLKPTTFSTINAPESATTNPFTDSASGLKNLPNISEFKQSVFEQNRQTANKPIRKSSLTRDFDDFLSETIQNQFRR